VQLRGDLRRLVVVCLLAVWSAAAAGVAIWLFATAARPLREIPAGQPGSVPGVNTLVSDLFPLAWLARGLLLLGLIMIGISWAIAFAGRGFSRKGTVGVAALFLFSFVAVWVCTKPVNDEWWSQGELHQVGAHEIVLDSLARDRRAEAVILLLAVLATCGLLAIAVARPAKTEVSLAPAGWYPDGTGRLSFWDGRAWTMQAPAASQD
jgi:hypothetical protein